MAAMVGSSKNSDDTKGVARIELMVADRIIFDADFVSCHRPKPLRYAGGSSVAP
jgi:hypothetical protein